MKEWRIKSDWSNNIPHCSNFITVLGMLPDIHDLISLQRKEAAHETVVMWSETE